MNEKASEFHLEIFGWLPFNKLLNLVPATNSVDSTGLPTLRRGNQLAKRWVHRGAVP